MKWRVEVIEEEMEGRVWYLERFWFGRIGWRKWGGSGEEGEGREDLVGLE